ncbi:hypothetical protein [Stappia sp.]|uniref:hypothetical protein n=1 Tax=Stappia sp. TaxID=1870903 RepID=UPI003A9A123C
MAKGSAIGEAVKVAAGCLIATGATLSGLPVPPGTVEAIFAGHAWFEKLSFTRRRDLQRVLARAAREVEAEMFAWVAQSSRTSEADLAHAQASCAEALPQVMPVPADLVGRNLAPPAIADLVLQRAETLHAAAYKDKGPKDPTSRITREFLRQVIERSCAHLLADPAFIDDLRPVLWRELLERTGRIEENTEDLLAGQRAQGEQLNRITALLAAMGDKAETARESGITDEEIVALAQRFSVDVSDSKQAFRELENAVEIAIRVQQEGRQGSNLGAFLDEVLRRVALLSARGAHDEATAEIDAALAEEEERRQASAARTIRLFESGIKQDLLRRDVESAAARLVRKAKIELPEGASLFDHLRAVWYEWYERGRDKGLNLDLEVAIALARRTVDLAAGADRRGAALNDLATALAGLGTHEASVERLEQALLHYRMASQEFTDQIQPLALVVMRINMGNVLQKLGELKSEKADLEAAVEAFKLALNEIPREGGELGWATTMYNLGNALVVLGRMEGGAERLNEAVAAHRLALEERKRDRAPIAWAMSQAALADALSALAGLETRTSLLHEALSSYRLALTELPREALPLEWARTQTGIGKVLWMLGICESGTEQLNEAVEAHQLALEEISCQSMPLEWAAIQNNLANALADLGVRKKSKEFLEKGVAAYVSALSVMTPEVASHHYMGTLENLALAQAELDRLRNGD